MSRILVFAGSARRASLNKRLAAVAAGMARDAGADVTEIDLADFPMPLYDGDLEDEHGVPAERTRLFPVLCDHDGWIVACPEYNGSITPLLKNTIDWISRKQPGEEPLQAFSGRTLLLLATSPGALGGLRGLVHVRAILGGLGMLVVPGQFALPKGHDVLGADGMLGDASAAGRLAGVVREFLSITDRLAR